MFSTYSTSIVHRVHVQYIQYKRSTYSTCSVLYIQNMFSTYSTSAAHTVHVQYRTCSVVWVSRGQAKPLYATTYVLYNWFIQAKPLRNYIWTVQLYIPYIFGPTYLRRTGVDFVLLGSGSYLDHHSTVTLKRHIFFKNQFFMYHLFTIFFILSLQKTNAGIRVRYSNSYFVSGIS